LICFIFKDQLHNNEMNLKFNDRLIGLRKSKGLTQQGLAKASGINKSNIGRWETTAIKPSEKNITKLASALGVPISELAPPEDALTENIVGLLRQMSSEEKRIIETLVEALCKKKKE